MNQDETNAENQTQEVTQDINSSGENNAQHEDPSLQRDTEDGGVNAENRDDSRPTLAQDYSGGIVLMEEVEVFYKNEWKKGEVRAIRPKKLHVLMKDLGEEYMFTFDKIRYSWRWEEQQLLKEKEKGEQSLKEKEKGEQSPKEKEKGGNKLKRIKTPSFDLKIVTPPEEKADEKGNKRQDDNTLADNHLKRMKKRKLESRGNDQQILRRSNRVATPSQPLVTPYKAPRNPAASRHPIFDPLLSPTFDMVEELMAWKESKKTETSIDQQCLQPLTPQWFDELGKPGTYLRATHINAALTMMCMQRDRDPTFFRNRRLPRASFMTIEFMKNLADCHSAFKKDKMGYEFPVELTDVVKGEMSPNKKWGEEI
ncbi:hypothetical protein ISN44_As13g008240 [Arabidopsis suecica]|uniref:Uncharacterized protein n=1 Tax=Arabidopsis suecica TaxID=45249 RepID=A0A8T1XQN7_ARASU|nr:hypothetical protein ISN44_As13g008240 [Arabidopsis suecica]KAG7536901.1 hypothetical protein ISN44_As13g008240 [Arabidopsis suecica]